MQNQRNNFEIINMSPHNTNSVLVSRGDDCFIFDPWGRTDAWLQLIRERKLTPRAIFATHGHPDHISAAFDLSATCSVPFYMSASDNFLIGWGNDILEYYGLPHINNGTTGNTDLAAARDVVPGMNIIASPGHTPGGVCYHFPDDRVLIAGDTLFANGAGRTDFPGGDAAALRTSITTIYNMNLPHETCVVSGHGPISTIGDMIHNNPYFRGV